MTMAQVDPALRQIVVKQECVNWDQLARGVNAECVIDV